MSPAATAEELKRKLVDRKPSGLTKSELPTPALIMDLDLFEANIAKMAAHAKATGKGLRPHAKTHKCVPIVQRQVAAGALGVSVATVSEAELMAAGGIKSILLTSPIADPRKMERMTRLVGQADEIIVAVDHPRQVEWYDAVAAAAGRKLNVLVDLNTGDRRTGAEPGEKALELGKQVVAAKNLQLRGVQAYSGSASHKVGFDLRRTYSLECMGLAADTRNLFLKHGLPADMFSGTSTGTYNIDCELPELTEMQVGSYTCMDVDYRRIGGKGTELYQDFGHSLKVMVMVISANHPERVTIDGGFKAFSTDRTFPADLPGVTGAEHKFLGDEFSAILLDNPSREFRLGDRLELIPPHCDPTVNLYDRIYACRGEKVEEIWPVMDRLR